VSEVVSESVAALSELATRNRNSRVDVLLANFALILKSVVDVVNGELEGLLGVLSDGAVQLGLVEAWSREKSRNVEGLLAKEIPVCFVKRLLEVATVESDNRVPKSMGLVDLRVTF
jgi:hypothetical protein